MTETRDGATDAVLPTLQEVSRVMLDLGAPVTPPRPTAPTAAELREAFLADYRAEHWPMLQRLDALIAAVRAETQRETYAMAARIADFEGAHGVSNRIRALVSK